MTVTIIVGNPKPQSRTFLAAHLVAERLTGRRPDHADDLGAALLDWSDPDVAGTVATVQASDLVVVASPTCKATYTGLLKLFLDRIGGGALAGITASEAAASSPTLDAWLDRAKPQVEASIAGSARSTGSELTT